MSLSAAILLAHDWASESRRGSRESGLSPRAALSAFMNSNIFWLFDAAFVTAAEATDGTRPTVDSTAARQIAMRDAPLWNTRSRLRLCPLGRCSCRHYCAGRSRNGPAAIRMCLFETVVVH